MTWHKSELDNVAQFINGDRGKNYPSKDAFVNAGIPFINAGSIADGQILKDELNYITDECFDKLNSGKVTKGDILFCLRGSLGKYAVIDKDLKAAIASSLIIIRPKQNVSLGYLKHFIASPLCANEISNYANGAAQPNLSASDLKKFQIPLPPLEDQRQIAAILDKADAIRRKRQEAIKLADEFLRAVFLDMFGDPVENTKSWKVAQLKDLSTKIHSGNTPTGGSEVYVDKGIPFFRSQNVWKNNLVFDDIAYIDEKTHKNMAKSSLKNRDILMTKTGRINTENSSLGRAALYEGNDDNANINGHVYLIRLADKSLCEFILFILTTKEYRDYIRSVCVGGIDKRQLNKDHLEQFPIILPPIELINKFLNIHKTINHKRKLSTLAHGDSIELFNGLNQKAFSGNLN